MSAGVVDWLVDSDPAIRWQVLQDLCGASDDVVRVERGRVATEGWGAQLLALQDADGTWDGGVYRPGWVDESKPFYDAWTATHYSLLLLRDLGLDPASPAAVVALSRVRTRVRWDNGGAPYFAGETEPCINGMTLAIGAHFGTDVDGSADRIADRIVDRLLDDQLADGGWNCWAEYGARVSSFHTTMCVLEGLLAWERTGGSSDAVRSARRAGEEYLLERRLFRSRSTGRVVDPRFAMFSFPTRWYYDVLRGLDYFRGGGAAFDDRCAEAVELVAAKRDRDGRWPLENTHQGPTHFEMEGPDGEPSRWNTLRALRVLDWAGAGIGARGEPTVG